MEPLGVQIQARIAAARMHTWLDGAPVADMDIEHTGTQEREGGSSTAHLGRKKG